jgi:hypothetical protein
MRGRAPSTGRRVDGIRAENGRPELDSKTRGEPLIPELRSNGLSLYPEFVTLLNVGLRLEGLRGERPRSPRV